MAGGELSSILAKSDLAKSECQSQSYPPIQSHAYPSDWCICQKMDVT